MDYFHDRIGCSAPAAPFVVPPQTILLSREEELWRQSNTPPPIGHNSRVNGMCIIRPTEMAPRYSDDPRNPKWCDCTACWAELGKPKVIEPKATAIVVNPKEAAGSKKPATWSVMPRAIMLAVGRVMSVGASKYGAFNYRDTAISASIYQDAMERHSALWFDGEDDDPETGVSHLASVMASCALLMDAQASGKLHDDRQKTGRVRPYLDKLEGLLVTLPLPLPKTA